MRVWLDDIRDPSLFVEDKRIWVKTYQEAINLLKTGEVTHISLDHDLGVGRKGSGYDVVVWMEEHGTWPKDGVTVHTANPVGARRMIQAIEANGIRAFRLFTI